MKVWKAILKSSILLLVLAGLCWGGYQYYLSRQDVSAAAPASDYTQVAIGTGNLTQTVTGSGSLIINKKADVTRPFPVTIQESLVREGELVTKGTPIARIDETALKNAILTMNTELDEIDTSIAQLAASYTGSSNVSPSAGGRVKQIFAAEGDMTADVMKQYGALTVLSCDGHMRVSIRTSELTLDQRVTVWYGKQKYTGTVTAVTENTADIIFPDTSVLPGDTVEIVADGEKIGEGQAVINMPLSVSTTLDGYVDAVQIRLNANVTKRSSLFRVTHIPASTEYNMLVAQRAEKLNALALARETLIAGVITADVDGIVATAPIVSSEEVAAQTAISTVYVGDAMQMDISVDELDIIHVHEGQTVSIAMDAVTDKVYTATVSYISQIGTPSSGVTNYSVTLDVDSDSQLKIGMNGTATIIVNEVENAVLVPLSAVHTGRRGSYVWKYTGEKAEGSDIPGEQVYITTGLSDEDYAVVTSGLNVGDVILVTRTASSGKDRVVMPAVMMDSGSMPAAAPSSGGGRRH